MKLQKYGITLERLTEAEIEMVRKYRNAAEVKNFMQFRKHITRRMQKKWFKSIDNDLNYYFIIIYEGKKIGLINIKNIIWDSKTDVPESGLFLWDLDYIDSPAPLLASFVLSEIGYGFLGGDTSKIKILKTNLKAIDFNKKMGYSETESCPDGFSIYLQTKKSFISATAALRKKALILCNNDPALYMYIEPYDWNKVKGIKFHDYLEKAKYNYSKQLNGSTEIYKFLFDFS
jgi:hypothetical protein